MCISIISIIGYDDDDEEIVGEREEDSLVTAQKRFLMSWGTRKRFFHGMKWLHDRYFFSERDMWGNRKKGARSRDTKEIRKRYFQF